MGRYVLLLLMGMGGCAPAYHSPALHAPLFSDGQQLSFAGHLSESGGQLSAAYAPVNHFAVRGRAQARPYEESDEQYWVVAMGVEGFEATNDTMRVSVGAEVGVGRVDAVDTVTILGSSTVYSANGALLQVAIPMTMGWDLGAVRTGFAARLVAHTLFNDIQWTGSTRGTLGIVEAAGFFRVGGTVAFEAQAGLSIPVLQRGDVASTYAPILIGVGLVVDLDLRKKREELPVEELPEEEPSEEEPSDGD